MEKPVTPLIMQLAVESESVGPQKEQCTSNARRGTVASFPELSFEVADGVIRQ